MVSTERRQIGVDGSLELSVLARDASADRTPFLLVHGLASNAHLWDGVGDRLYEAGHSSLAVDLRGHGHSDRPDAGYDFQRITDDLRAVVDSAGWSSVVVVGQSWGGNVVVEFGARHPDVTAGVVCVDGGFLRLSEAFPDWNHAARELAPPDFSGLTMEQLRSMSRGRFADWPPEGRNGQLANFEVHDGGVRARLSRDRHMTILRHLWEHDPDVAARKVAAPAMVVAVDRDADGRERRVQDFAASFGRPAEVVWFDAHHDVHAQRPDGVARTLLAFEARL